MGAGHMNEDKFREAVSQYLQKEIYEKIRKEGEVQIGNNAT